MKTRILMLAFVFSAMLGFSQNEKTHLKSELMNQQISLDILQQKLRNAPEGQRLFYDENTERFYLSIKWLRDRRAGGLGYDLKREETRDEYRNIGLIGYLGDQNRDLEFWTFETQLFDGPILTGQVVRGTVEKDQNVEEDDGD